MQPQGAFCWYFKVFRVNGRQQWPHTLLKLLTTTFCSQEWLILLGRFVSELIYISYFAMQTTEVKSCAFWRASHSYFTKYPEKLLGENFSFLSSVWRLSPSSSWRQNVSTKTSVGKGRVLPHHPPGSTPQILKCQSRLFFTQHQVWSWDGSSEANNC